MDLQKRIWAVFLAIFIPISIIRGVGDTEFARDIFSENGWGL